MKKSDLLRHRIIQGILAQPTESVADAAFHIWGQMSAQIISIVGVGGFNSLYARSVFLTQSTFPWLAVSIPSRQTSHGFDELKLSLEAQLPAQASEANLLLLITFTDILASLIGEQLTTSILRSAWSIDASDIVSKEFENE